MLKIQLCSDIKAKNKNFEWEDVHVKTQKLHSNNFCSSNFLRPV